MKLGWALDRWMTSYWRDDPAVDWEGTPEDARKRYEETGDGSVLTLRPGMTPTTIRFRALTTEERIWVLSQHAGATDADFDASSKDDSAAKRRMFAVLAGRLFFAFRIGAQIDGVERREVSGYMMLPDRIDPELLYLFYGRLILSASTLSDDEKKTSSPVPPPSDKPPDSSSA